MLALVLVAAACGGTPPSASSLPSAETSPRLPADTSVWDGSHWRPAHVPGPPPRERDGASMVTAGSRVLLFGGHVANLTYFGDLYEWTATTWIRVDAAPRPPGRSAAAVTWDEAHSSLVVFGGSGINPGAGPGNSGISLGDGWAWNGRKWSAIGG